jgi:hemolysin activation/secretion protein
MKKTLAFFSIFFTITILPTLAYSQTPPSSQSAGGIQAQEEQQQKEQQLEKQIKSKKKATPEAAVTPNAALPEEGQKTLVKAIDVKGATLIPQRVVDNIIKNYEGKELSLRDMQKVCDLITDEYRKRGRVTSRAYMPPQTISAQEAILVIIVIEGKVGTIDVKGNKYFSSQLIKRRLEVKPGEYFDYAALQRALVEINDHTDRFVKVGLVPGKEPGTTDLIVEVQDRIPLHVGLENDDFGSKYMHYLRNTFTAQDNNLTGLDDKLFFQYQRSLGQYYSSPYVSYTAPINNKFDAGAYWLWSDTKLGKEYKSLDIKGKTSIGGPFFNYEAINADAVNLKLTGGFDYKRVTNYENGEVISRDEDRVLKGGINLDTTDKFGRTVFTLEEDVGMTGGGLYDKDPLATEPGAGAKFQKLSGYLYRLQPMPFSSDILWKNAFQYTNYNLLSVEQMQLGGISNVRGYDPASYAGDSGVTSSLDWSFPLYCLPKDTIVPHSKSTFYDATRLVIFYDVGHASLHSPTGDGKPSETLQSLGYGIRFNLLENFSARVEVAYPLNPEGESSHAHLYWDFAKKW